jgi:hypothetical protein
VSRVKDVSKGIRQDYPPKVRELIARVGDRPIVEMYVRRDAISAPINTALNLLTLGKWAEVRRRYHYDELFHLAIEVVVRAASNTESEARYVVEKNQVINVAPPIPTKPTTEFLPVPLGGRGFTINGLLNGAKSRMGPNFFIYDAYTNNCQDFIMNILLSAGLANPTLTAFVKQPLEKALSEMPGYTSGITKAATNLGALADVALQGRGGLKPSRKFAAQLAKLGIAPAAYLKAAQKKANAAGLVGHLIGFSDDEKHKLQVPNADGKIVKFGASGLGDHLIYRLSGNSEADEHRRRYRARATKIRGNWKSDDYSPNSLALEILW